MTRLNRLAFWVNDRKAAANHPDYKGKFELSWELLQEALASFNSGQYETDYNGQPCIKLDVALYAQQLSFGDNKPVLSGNVSTVMETQSSAAARQQAAQGHAQAPQQQAPQGHAQLAQPQYAQPQAPQAPQAPQGWPGGFVGQAQQPQMPQPVYQQGAPQGYTAGQGSQPQAPTPVAPPAPVHPMPGAIHGQPPAAPQPQYAPTGLAPVLPQNF